jgi:hypothetical protein
MKACDLVRREYNTLAEFGVSKQLVRLIKMCVNETFSEVCIGRYLSHTFAIQNGLKLDALLPLLFTSALEYTNTKIQGN